MNDIALSVTLGIYIYIYNVCWLSAIRTMVAENSEGGRMKKKKYWVEFSTDMPELPASTSTSSVIHRFLRGLGASRLLRPTYSFDLRDSTPSL